MENRIHLRYHDPECVCATFGRLFLLVWRGPATLERTRAVTTEMRAFAADSQAGFAALIVVHSNSPPPQGPARQLFAQAMKEIDERVLGAAYLVPFTGFKGAAIRSVITGLSLLARERYPTRAFSDTGQASRWLGELLASGNAAAAWSVHIPMILDQIDPAVEARAC